MPVLDKIESKNDSKHLDVGLSSKRWTFYVQVTAAVIYCIIPQNSLRNRIKLEIVLLQAKSLKFLLQVYGKENRLISLVKNYQL